jgi:hypothetical protein
MMLQKENQKSLHATPVDEALLLRPMSNNLLNQGCLLSLPAKNKK